MRIRNKATGVAMDATKNTDGTYTVNGETLTKEQMTELYTPIKEKAKEESDDVSINIPPPKVEFVGDDLSAMFEAIAKVSGQMVNLNKGKEAFNYKYITLGQVIDMTRKPLADYGLAIMNFPSTYWIGKQLMTRVELILSHKSGCRISSVFDVPVDGNKKQVLVQSIATVQSYCVRYHRVNLLGIAGEDDTDGSDK